MKNGFTLIELAIVVVVLGILIGGVLTGQSLIESANKQKVITNFNKLKTGLNAFKLEFDAIPGDFDEAYDYWGDDCANVSHPPQRIGMCNGDGDNKITAGNSGFHYYCFSWACERCMFLRHMSLAGILSESYNCIEESTAIKNPLNSESYLFVSNRCEYGRGVVECNTPNRYTHNTYIMSNGSSITSHHKWLYCRRGSFNPKQLKYIDEKIDDGKPKTGILVAAQYTGGNNICHYSTITSGACLLNNTENAYNVANDDYVCEMHYRLGL
jgi:prepilin-type N-terminal cleavage/methylation domain-containing protein